MTTKFREQWAGLIYVLSRPVDSWASWVLFQAEKRGYFLEDEFEGLATIALERFEKTHKGFVGKVGDRIKLNLTCEDVFIANSNNRLGYVYVFLFTDDEGHTFKYKGSVNKLPRKTYTSKISFTVKDHEYYHGRFITVIQRPIMVIK